MEFVIREMVGNKVLAEILPLDTTTEGGILIVEKDKREAKVLMKGPDVKHVNVGDIVRFYPHCGNELEYGNKKCIILKELTDIELIL